MTKDEILAQIRRAAADNGGQPLGRDRFQQATGIGEHDWGRYWARFGDAVREAGFEPNKFNPAFEHEHLMESLAAVTRELGRVPTDRELRIRRHQDAAFPSHNTYRRYGGKSGVLGALLTYTEGRAGYEGIADLCRVALTGRDRTGSRSPEAAGRTEYGFVYLARGHRGEYKIGRTTLVDRRVSELGATGPVALTLVHEIKTDDPVGVEAYWHRRFEQKRMRGEWFSLTASDVTAFKRWKRIA